MRTEPAATLRALVLSCHPVPTLAVTTFALLLSLPAQDLTASAALTSAVLFGQLAIGWHNDLTDAARDRAAGRRDKPIATGAVPSRLVAIALATALALTILLSAFASGLNGLLLHVTLVVGSGLAYNAGMKATPWSWLPYAVAFGALPAFVWVATGRGAAPWWVIATGALLGVGAHLLNVVPDIEDDRRAGVSGLPHRIGARAATVVAPLVLVAGSALLAVAPPEPTPVAGWLLLAAAVVLAGIGLLAPGRWPFLAAIGIALLNVLALISSG